MTLTFYSNRLNHHQAPVADELFRLLGSSYRFVETEKPSGDSNKGSTEDYTSRPYLIQAWKDESCKALAKELTLSSDVAVFGAVSSDYEVLRVRKTGKLSFDMSERWFKRGILNLLSPRLIKHFWDYHTLYRRKPVFKLCASAHAAKDQQLLLSFQDRCFKWGYFPDLPEVTLNGQPLGNPVRFMWCARFLKLKHPELAIKLVSRLVQKGYPVSLDMFGDGSELAPSKKLASDLGMNRHIRFWGSRPNKEVIDQMRDHDVFLFTSDRHEGWGVVANEAMSTGCVLVASDAIGSTPYLVKHRETGIVFKSGSLDSLVEEVEWLLNHKSDYQAIKKNGQEHVFHLWNPRHAAESLVCLSEGLLMDVKARPIKEGPCSKA